jgi:hypothetical protein
VLGFYWVESDRSCKHAVLMWKRWVPRVLVLVSAMVLRMGARGGEGRDPRSRIAWQEGFCSWDELIFVERGPGLINHHN